MADEPPRLRGVASLAPQLVWIDPGLLGDDRAVPGPASTPLAAVLARHAAGAFSLEKKPQLPELCQLFLPVCDALVRIHSAPDRHLGFLAAADIRVDPSLANAAIVLSEDRPDNDRFEFGVFIFAVAWLVFQPPGSRQMLPTAEFVPPVPLAFPFFIQTLVAKTTLGEPAARPTFSWLSGQLRSILESPPPDNPLKMDPSLYDFGIRIADLQSLLMDVTPESLDNTVEELLQSDFVQDLQMIEQFVHYLVIAVFHRPAKVPLFATTVARLVRAVENDAVANEIKKDILRMFPGKPASAGYWANANAQMRFLWETLNNELFSKEDIVGMIRSLVEPGSNDLKRVVVHMFAYFAEVVQDVDPDLFQQIERSLPAALSSLPFVFRRAFDDLESLAEDGWARLRRMRNDPSDIRIVLRTDNIDELRRRSQHPAFSVNDTLGASLFEPCFMLNSGQTLLHYAVFYGAMKCFNYLTVSGGDIHAQDDDQKTIVHHAIAGGHIEIMRFCEHQKLGFEGSIEVSIQLYQHEIFDWLRATRFPKFDEHVLFGSLVSNAARTNNVAMILFAIEHHLDLNAPDSSGSSPLFLASLFGYTDIVRLLLSDPRADVNAAGRRAADLPPIIIACFEGYEDTVRALLGHPGVRLLPRHFETSPLRAAVHGKVTRIIELVARQEPAAITVVDVSGLAPLQFAILLGADATWYNMLLDLLPDHSQLSHLDSPRFRALCHRERKTNLLAMTLAADTQGSGEEEDLE
jgi:ankyrin repeat protein